LNLPIIRPGTLYPSFDSKFEVNVNGKKIKISISGFNSLLVTLNETVAYHMRIRSCEFQLNADLTIIGNCHGVVCCVPIVLFTRNRTAEQEIIENYNTD
jgi:hypothetical protein